MDTVYSKHGVPIRLTPERWMHIVENHDDLAGYGETVLEAIADPDVVLKRAAGGWLALQSHGRRTLVVAYREISKVDGFVITAFFTTQAERIRKRGSVVWQKH